MVSTTRSQVSVQVSERVCVCFVYAGHRCVCVNGKNFIVQGQCVKGRGVAGSKCDEMNFRICSWGVTLQHGPDNRVNTLSTASGEEGCI